MKNQKLILVPRQFEPALEAFLNEKDLELNELAAKTAKHYARKNQPSADGDSLAPFTEQLKSAYEKLGADAVKHLQAIANMPIGKMDIEAFQEKMKTLTEAIEHRKNQVANDEFDLGDYNSTTINKQLWLAIGLTGLITLGEIIFNTKAFQIVGESLLFALLISSCITIAVLFFSHFIPYRIKEAKTIMTKRIITISSLALVTTVFIAMGILRSKYLAAHGVDVNPFFFVVINLFLFIVSFLISYYILPTIQEIKLNAVKSKIHKAIVKGKEEIQKLEAEKAILEEQIQESTKNKIRLMQYAKDITFLILKMYWHSIGIFKNHNLTWRPDRKVPTCFSENLPEPDITNKTNVLLNPIRKAS